MIDSLSKVEKLKTRIPALTIGLALALIGQATAQTFTVVHTLTGPEGISPWGGLLQSSNALYGSTMGGGYTGGGTLFKINTDGSGFTNIHHLDPQSDGWGPHSPLILVGGTLYGTAQNGGSSN